MKKTNVQTNLLGRQAFLTKQNAEAAVRYVEQIDPTKRLPWVNLHPKGGEVVAVFTDREGELNVTLSTDEGLVTIATSWLRIA